MLLKEQALNICHQHLRAKYLFTPDAAFSPYVGLGLNYTLVFDENSDLGKLKGKDSIGLAANVGFEYRMPNSPWGISADLRYIKIESDLTLGWC
jgi:outer membrane protein